MLDTKRCGKCINVDGMVAMGDVMVGFQPSIRGLIKKTKKRIYSVLDMTHVNGRQSVGKQYLFHPLCIPLRTKTILPQWVHLKSNIQMMT